MKKILIPGAGGMLAHDLMKYLGGYAELYEVVGVDRKTLDVTDASAVFGFFEKHTPDVVINCAAYTAVDQAEGEGMLHNYQVNALGVGILAKASSMYGADFIHISTDYVFDGERGLGYMPSDMPAPINAYGMAKYLGEQIARQHHPESIILRTSWLYGGGVGYKNFVNTMLRLGTPPPAPPERRGAKDINVVCDQIGLPTYTLDLSAYMHHVISHIGTYHGRTVHANNSGEHVSRHGFACEIFEIARTMSMNVHKDLHVMSCASDEYPTAAKRPSYSVMLSDDESYMMPDWKDALGRYVERLGSTS